jgi:hypothetical protein
MSFNPLPSTFFGAGYGESGSTTTHAITLNTAGHTTPLLAEVTETEADPSNAGGDYRKVLFGIAEMIYQKWLGLDAEDRPTKMQVFRSSSVNETTGHITRNYTLQFIIAPDTVEVVSE